MSEIQINSSPDSTGDLILGKFKSTGDLAEAYKQLESKLGAGFAKTPEEAAEVPPTTVTENTEAATITTTESTDVYGDALVSAVSAAGLDINKVAEEWASESGVSTDTRAALDKTFGATVVDAYFKGLEAQQSDISNEAQKAIADITAVVGGDEAWNTVATWAGGVNGPADLVEAYNSAIDRGDAVTMKALAGALKGSYEAANGSLNSVSVTSGQPAGVGGTAGFRSQSEVMQAMRDPRYKTDAAFRADVAQRLKATDGFTVS